VFSVKKWTFPQRKVRALCTPLPTGLQIKTHKLAASYSNLLSFYCACSCVACAISVCSSVHLFVTLVQCDIKVKRYLQRELQYTCGRLSSQPAYIATMRPMRPHAGPPNLGSRQIPDRNFFGYSNFLFTTK